MQTTVMELRQHCLCLGGMLEVEDFGVNDKKHSIYAKAKIG